VLAQKVVRLTQTGWKTGDEWDRAYRSLIADNVEFMSTPHRRFARVFSQKFVESPHGDLQGEDVDASSFFAAWAKGKSISNPTCPPTLGLAM